MIRGRWWERLPERLEHELQALRQANVLFDVVDDALAAGVYQLKVRSVVDGSPASLLVTFPDLYPYFRFEVAAPDIQLPYHQHPVSKFLCLLGRSTHFWNTDDTVAQLLIDQVPRVFETARNADRAAVVGLEQQQAEPFGDYYPYAPSMILVQGNWVIPPGERSGTLLIGIGSGDEQLNDPLVRGAVLEVRDNKRAFVASAGPALRRAYSSRTLTARWVRADAPLGVFDQKQFFERVQRMDPGRQNNQAAAYGGGRLRIWGVVFPEEIGHRAVGQGWVFVCDFERERTITKAGRFSPQRREKQVENRTYFSRAGRAGPEDVRLRTPELRPLTDKTVALFGLGCVGAPTALELARAGLGCLKVVDDDIVDAGTVGRWPVGLSAAGRKKVEVIREWIERDYPYTRAVALDRRIGGTRTGAPGEDSDEEVLRKIVDGASLICETTAEIGLQHFLSDLARHLNVPFVSVAGTPGGWGGKVVRILPGVTDGCWMCYKLACRDGTIEEPPADEERPVQPQGCGNPTFTGSGFDLTQVALTGVRTIVSTLCIGRDGGYPPIHWDVMTVAFRDEGGRLIEPSFRGYVLKKHPECASCNARRDADG